MRLRKKRFKDTRTEEELKEVGRTLYKGCKRHFEDSVDRICKITEVLGREDVLRDLVDTMLNSEDPDDFNRAADEIEEEFPALH